MNKLILVLSILTLSFSLSAQIDIGDARNMSIGSTVTIEGIATNGEELSIIRYVQDETGGIAVYPGMGSVADFPESVSRGDLVQVTGALKSFNGLLEIDPVTAFNVISSNNTLPDPLEVNPSGINEANEAKLLQINGATFVDGGSVFAVGNYTFSANGETSEIYLRSGHPMLGQDIPLATINLRGIASEFNGQYQLLPRDLDDFEIADNFYFTSIPAQSDLTTDGFKLEWKTNVAGTTTIEYGTTSALGEEVTVAGMTTDHTLTLTDLEPATVYYAKAVSNNGSSTIKTNVKVFITQSNSSGEMRVYFNNPVDASFSNGTDYPTNVTGGALEQAIINRIQGAQSTIDVAAYNINRTTIVAALTEAYNNGIIVRYIADDETANLALSDPTPPFPVIKGNIGSPLMHNKFIVVDAESVDHSWVFSGSTNLTEGNVGDDFNNSLFIQDQALARAYTLEFQEMWGSEGPDPGIFNLIFGENKVDNTPHLFNINGTMVESYFSPSDNTTVNIIKALKTGDTDVEIAMLAFTHNELGTTVRDIHDAGIDTRVIIDMPNSTGSEFDFLENSGVNVTADNNSSKQTHHKYAIVDATDANSEPLVITGSHNWSAGAEDRNDENTLIIHSAAIANIFLQEFEARWCEATGGTACITSTNEVEIEGFEVSLSPNPASDYAIANMEIEKAGDLSIALLDANGRILNASFLSNVQGTINEKIIVKDLPAGMYLVMFSRGGQVTAKQLIVR